RHDDRPGLPGAQLSNEKLWTVREQEGDTIIWLDPSIRQRRGKGIAESGERLIGNRPSLKEDGRVVRPLLDGLGDISEECVQWVGREGLWHTLVIVRQPVLLSHRRLLGNRLLWPLPGDNSALQREQEMYQLSHGSGRDQGQGIVSSRSEHMAG